MLHYILRVLICVPGTLDHYIFRRHCECSSTIPAAEGVSGCFCRVCHGHGCSVTIAGFCRQCCRVTRDHFAGVFIAHFVGIPVVVDVHNCAAVCRNCLLFKLLCCESGQSVCFRCGLRTGCPGLFLIRCYALILTVSISIHILQPVLHYILRVLICVPGTLDHYVFCRHCEFTLTIPAAEGVSGRCCIRCNGHSFTIFIADGFRQRCFIRSMVVIYIAHRIAVAIVVDVHYRGAIRSNRFLLKSLCSKAVQTVCFSGCLHSGGTGKYLIRRNTLVLTVFIIFQILQPMLYRIFGISSWQP